MRMYWIRRGATGEIIWTGSAIDPFGALDAMAHEAGYYDHADIPDYLRAGGFQVEEIQF